MVHHARPEQDWSAPYKWCWTCPQCGAWSRGYRYTTEDGAQIGALKHNVTEEQADRDAARAMGRPWGG